MADENKRPIIIKKKKVIAGGHHGGAWKVAYADFVTAMMAFFLLMWLLNATTEDQRKGLADYFNPQVPISEVSGGGSSMFGGDSVFSEDTLAQSGTGGSDAKSEAESAYEQQREIVEREKMSDIGVELVEGIQNMESTDTNIDGDMLPHMRLTVTNEGLLIELVDVDGKPLFESGSKKPSKNFTALMKTVSTVLRTVDNQIKIYGHTDAKQFAPGSTYTNWELSADRANIARSLMEKNNIAPARIAGVAGLADVKPVSKDPFAAENRRIAILLLKNTVRP